MNMLTKKLPLDGISLIDSKKRVHLSIRLPVQAYKVTFSSEQVAPKGSARNNNQLFIFLMVLFFLEFDLRVSLLQKIGDR